ncbi:MAG: YihY family inner membrane protein [Oligoflexus sp.]
MLEKIRNNLSIENLPPWMQRMYLMVRTVLDDITETNLMLHAGSMAYMTLGSIVPSLAVTFSIIAIFQPLSATEANWFMQFRTFILNNLAPQAGEDMVGFIEQFLENIDLAKIGVTNLLFLFGILILLLRNIEIAMNSVWQVSNTRPLFKRFIYFWIAITLGALALSVAISVFASFDASSWLPFSAGKIEDKPGPASTFMTLLVTFVFFSLLHKIGPNCKVSFKAAVMGGLSATIMIRLASFGYGIYAQNSQWNQNLYDALAVVPLFLIWLYVGWLVVLFSAIIAWRTQHGLSCERGKEGAVLRGNHELEDDNQVRNIQIRAILPVICVFAAGHRFMQARGEGLRGADLAKEFEIPLIWVREAMLIAENRGLIVIERSHQDADDMENEEDIIDLQFYPAYPLDQLTIGLVLEKLAKDSLEWLKGRQGLDAMDVKRIVEELFQNLQKGQLQTKLQTLLRA